MKQVRHENFKTINIKKTHKMEHKYDNNSSKNNNNNRQTKKH